MVFGVICGGRGFPRYQVFFALSFASLSTSSLHVIFVWARTFLMVML